MPFIATNAPVRRLANGIDQSKETLQGRDRRGRSPRRNGPLAMQSIRPATNDLDVVQARMVAATSSRKVAAAATAPSGSAVRSGRATASTRPGKSDARTDVRRLTSTSGTNVAEERAVEEVAIPEP